MAQGLRISISVLKILGAVEVTATILFIIRRTGIVGFLLLVAFVGGAMSAHLITSESLLFPAIIQAFLLITAFLRFPELSQKIYTTKR